MHLDQTQVARLLNIEDKDLITTVYRFAPQGTYKYSKMTINMLTWPFLEKSASRV
jgi:hypothetical protein